MTENERAAGGKGGRRPRRPTGIPRRRLDRSKRFVIAFVGNRWVVVGEHRGEVAPWTYPAAEAGGGAEGPSTASAPGRHAAPPPEDPHTA